MGPLFFNQLTFMQQTLTKDKFRCGGLEQKCMLLYGEDKAFQTFDFLITIFTSFIIRFGPLFVTFVLTGALNES